MNLFNYKSKKQLRIKEILRIVLMVLITFIAVFYVYDKTMAMAGAGILTTAHNSLVVKEPGKDVFCNVRIAQVGQMNWDRRAAPGVALAMSQMIPRGLSRASNAMYEWAADYAYTKAPSELYAKSVPAQVCLDNIDRLRFLEKSGDPRLVVVVRGVKGFAGMGL